MAFVDDLSRIFLVLGFAGESKCVLRFTIGNLVDPKILLVNEDRCLVV
jgi:hypothetical protein